MVKIDASDTQIDQKEVTAFIQQQMVDLAPHLTEKASLQVRLIQKKELYEAELTAFEEEGEIQTVGIHKDVFDAIKNAKEGLLEYFMEVENELHPHLRDEKINYMAKHGSLYLH